MSLTQLQKVQLAKAVGSAKACEAATGCPAELSVAQWALESGWGSRQPGNNCFGIKFFPGCYGVQLIDTLEVENGQKVQKRLLFATFENLDACFIRHAKIITKAPAYHKAFVAFKADSGSMDKLIHAIAPIYATDPDYAAKLLTILAMPEVAAALQLAGLQDGNSYRKL